MLSGARRELESEQMLGVWTRALRSFRSAHAGSFEVGFNESAATVPCVVGGQGSPIVVEEHEQRGMRDRPPGADVPADIL